MMLKKNQTRLDMQNEPFRIEWWFPWYWDYMVWHWAYLEFAVSYLVIETFVPYQ
jgi:hypothetical protein